MTYELRIYKDGVLQWHDTIGPKTSLQIDAVFGFPGMSVRLEYIPDKDAQPGLRRPPPVMLGTVEKGIGPLRQ